MKEVRRSFGALRLAFFSWIYAYSFNSSHRTRQKKCGVFLLCLYKSKVRDGTKLFPFTNREKLVKYDVSQKGEICQRPLYFWLILARTRWAGLVLFLKKKRGASSWQYSYHGSEGKRRGTWKGKGRENFPFSFVWERRSLSGSYLRPLTCTNCRILKYRGTEYNGRYRIA